MFSFLILVVSLVANASAIKLKDSRLEFIAVGKPAMIKIVGESNDLAGSIDESEKDGLSGNLILNVKSLKTGINMRDEHMKEKYLEVEKYPTATLKVQGVPVIASGKDLKKTISLPLSLHGVEQNVDVSLDMKNTSGIYSGSAEFTIKLSDFSIKIPTYLGIKVADKVEVKVNFMGVH
jgi:polyisoprenoid-binding protein YceI